MKIKLIPGGTIAFENREQCFLSLGFQIIFQLRRTVEMIFDGPFVSAGNENHVGDACRSRFFHRILNQGFVNHRQHLFGHCLCRQGKKRVPRPATGKTAFLTGFMASKTKNYLK